MAYNAWTTGNSRYALLATYSILNLLVTNTAIQYKISDFWLFRFTLKVSISVSGSMYHSGRLAFNWKVNGGLGTNTTNKTAFPICDIAQYLQLPGVVFDPSVNQVQELSLKFTYNLPAMPLFGITGLTTYDSLFVNVLNPLQFSMTAAGSQNASYTIYAWFEDVELSGAVALPQSETSGKTISSFSDNMKRAITNYRPPGGLAAQAAGKGVTALMAMSGFGKPPIETNPTFVANLNSSMWQSDGYTINRPISNTKHCEVSSDNLMSGEDQMMLKNIWSREGYISTVVWTNGAGQGLLSYFDVYPFYYRVVTVAGVTGFLYPPVGYVANAFHFWRGSLKYRIEVVANSSMRGILRIRYVPNNGDSATFANSVTEYTSFINLETSTETTIVCPWMSPGLWINNSYETGSFNVYNGKLYFEIVNPLVAMNSTNAEINVFVSAGDDFQVYGADITCIGDVVMTANRDVTLQSSDVEVELQSSTVTMGVSGKMLDAKDSFGEEITSVKQLVNMPSFYCAILNPNADSGTDYCTIGMPGFPFYSNYTDFMGSVVPEYLETDTTSVCNTWINYWTPLYLAWKGSIRWDYYPNHGCDPAYKTSIMAFRVLTEIPNSGLQYLQASPVGTGQYAFLQDMSSGGLMRVPSDTDVVSFEFPWSWEYNWANAKNAGFCPEYYFFNIIQTAVKQTTIDNLLIGAFAVSAGPSFQLDGFQYVVPLFNV